MGFVSLRYDDTVLRDDRLTVTASFYPYYFIATEIGGDKANVINLTPSGVEPHDYELTPDDIKKIISSKFIVMNGVVEPWAEKIKDILKEYPINILTQEKTLFSQDYTDEENHKSLDPHIWLSPKLAKLQTDSIAEEYVKVDPKNSDYYLHNADNLKNKLDSLDKDYQVGLSNCQTKNIVTSHAAFGYLAKEYGLNQIAISGLTPDAEPSLKELSDTVNFVKKNKIKYIFFESLVSPKLSETIANEVGAQTLVLNPIEGLTQQETAEGKNYLDIMTENLKNLTTALKCQ